MDSDDDELTAEATRVAPRYTEAQEEQLARNLVAIDRDIHMGACRGERVRVDLLQGLHARLFNGVATHAGRTRARGFGQEYLVFGPNRSAHRSDVSRLLDQIFERSRHEIRACEGNPSAQNYEEASLKAAVRLHADIVRVHPFEDGNGRSSRALMNCVLVRLGLNPIAVEACKKEYNDCLNEYFGASGDLQPLLDLMLRLAAEQVES
jgi:fido (protein-threonine AMPylation protein)